MTQMNNGSHELLRLPLRQAAALAQSAYSTSQVVGLVQLLPSAGDKQVHLIVVILGALLARAEAEPEAAALAIVLQTLNTSFPLAERVAPDAEESEYAEHLVDELQEWFKSYTDLHAIGDIQQVQAFRLLAHIAAWYRRLALAPGLLRTAMAAAKRSGGDASEVLCHADMAECERHAGNIKAALSHYLLVAVPLATAHNKPALDELKESMAKRMYQFATHLYYQQAEYDLCYRLLQAVVRLQPEVADPRYSLGNVCIKLGKFSEALHAYTEQARLAPSATAYGNLALMHNEMKDPKSAMEAVTMSLRLEPEKVHSLVCRAILYTNSDNIPQAIADWISVLDQVEQRSPDVIAEFTDHGKMLRQAYIALLELYRHASQADALPGLATRLQHSKEEDLRAQGYSLEGELALNKGQTAAGRQAYEMALSHCPSFHPAQLALALLDGQDGHLDAALARLGTLASKYQAPKLARQGLEKLQKSFPASPQILRWLGYVAFQLYEFSHAEQLLSQYLEQMPQDLEAQRWLGQSSTSMPIEEGSDAVAGDNQRLFTGIKMLACAAVAGDAPARHTLTWLVDRLICEPKHFWAVLSIDDVGKMYPGLREHVHLLIGPAQEQANTPLQYAHRIRAVKQYMAYALDYGLECFATYLHSTIADLHLQCGQMQDALIAARKSQSFLQKVNFPCTPELQEEARSAAREDGAWMGVYPELEYMHIYPRLTSQFTEVEIITARVLLRSGAGQEASQIKLTTEHIKVYVQKQVPTSMILVAELMRDLNRMDEAQEILEQALSRADTDRERGRVLFAQSILSQRQGLAETALQQGLEAAPLMVEERRWLSWLNLALSTNLLGRYEETVEYLDRINIESAARSMDDHFNFHYLRASALASLGRHSEAYTSAKEAVNALEAMRATLLELELKGSWGGRADAAYRMALDMADKNGDLVAAFDLAERSRSRQLIDQMAIGSAQLGDQTSHLLHQIEKLEVRHRLISKILPLRLDHSDMPELLTQLQSLSPELDVAPWDLSQENSKLTEQLKRAKAAAEAGLKHYRIQLDQIQVAHAGQLLGEILDYRAVQNLLMEIA